MLLSVISVPSPFGRATKRTYSDSTYLPSENDRVGITYQPGDSLSQCLI